VVGAETYAATWTGRLATPATTSTIRLADDALAADTMGADGTELELATIDDGGHGWPGGQQYLPKAIVGTVVQTFSANDVILDFFERHPGH
jgi:poly(3-hydroxybutyrate) depolymerase